MASRVQQLLHRTPLLVLACRQADDAPLAGSAVAGRRKVTAFGGTGAETGRWRGANDTPLGDRGGELAYEGL